jgi:hypothetical protein
MLGVFCLLAPILLAFASWLASRPFVGKEDILWKKNTLYKFNRHSHRKFPL